MNKSVDIAIIGAGPAGISAAREVDSLGLKFVVIDEQQKIGGNIFRNYQKNLSANNDMEFVLGNDYSKSVHTMKNDFIEADEYLANAQVFSINQNGELGIKQKGEIFTLQAKKILIATGAVERPTPYPGWTIPGVMTVGAAQTMLKDALAVPEEPFIIIGSGPLLLLLVVQYIRMGIKPEAVLFSGPALGKRSSILNLLKALGRLLSILKGVSWLIKIISSNIKIYTNVTDIKITGDQWVQKVSFKCHSNEQEIDVKHVFTHEGVVPNTMLAMAADCQHTWNSHQRYWAPVIDEWGRTSAENIYVAGDSALVLGADVAPISGQLAAMSIATDLNHLDNNEKQKRSTRLLRRIKKEKKFRSLMDNIYPPPDHIRGDVLDDTVVCRCENITAGQIRALAEIQCVGINQAKAYTRCGMGACQGRMCGLTIAEIMAKAQNQEIDKIGYYNVRMPIRHITLGELATFHTDQEFSMLKMLKLRK